MAATKPASNRENTSVKLKAEDGWNRLASISELSFYPFGVSPGKGRHGHCQPVQGCDCEALSAEEILDIAELGLGLISSRRKPVRVSKRYSSKSTEKERLPKRFEPFKGSM